MGRAEGYVEHYLQSQVTAAGGLVYKFTSGTVGVPDRIVIAFGHTVFIECKAPHQTPRPIQNAVIADMRASGADVRIFDSRSDVDDFIKELTSWRQTFNPSTQPSLLPVPTIPLSGRRCV